MRPLDALTERLSIAAEQLRAESSTTAGYARRCAAPRLAADLLGQRERLRRLADEFDFVAAQGRAGGLRVARGKK